MRAELMVLGKHFDMARREHRRKLVVTIYALLAVVMAALGWVDTWRGSGYYLVFLALMINHFLLGGYGRSGLVRPFDGKAPREAKMPSPLIPLGLYLRLTSTLPESDWRSDERETVLRDRVHYQAYQWISAAVGAMWLLSGWATGKSQTFPILHSVAETLLYPVVLVAVILMLTLPQAILLWTEPDMPEFELEPDKLLA
jgi:hypothetical protein